MVDVSDDDDEITADSGPPGFDAHGACGQRAWLGALRPARLEKIQWIAAEGNCLSMKQPAQSGS